MEWWRCIVGVGGLGVPLAAFVGALVSLVAIERIATSGGRLTVLTLLLTGAIFNAFSAALIYFLQSVASREELSAIVFYLMGRVPSSGLLTLVGLWAAGVAITLALFASARDFNALTSGEEGASQLGVDVERLKRRTFVLGSLATALAVASAGLIGFVGLVVPHLLRRLLGPDHRLLLPAAFLGGASFLVLADLAARIARGAHRTAGGRRDGPPRWTVLPAAPAPPRSGIGGGGGRAAWLIPLCLRYRRRHRPRHRVRCSRCTTSRSPTAPAWRSPVSTCGSRRGASSASWGRTAPARAPWCARSLACSRAFPAA